MVGIIGILCMGMSRRLERQAGLVDPKIKTTNSSNVRQFRMLGVLLIVGAVSSLLYFFISNR